MASGRPLSPSAVPWPVLFGLAASACTGLTYYPGPLEKEESSPAVDGTTGDDDDVPGSDTDDTEDTEDIEDTEEPETEEVQDTEVPDTGTETLDTDTETLPTDTGTPPPPPPLSLASVEPAFGPTAGGTAVTLQGQFDLNTEVRFGGLLATVVSQTPTQMQVLSPAAPVGLVNVEVAAGSQSYTLNNAFRYWQDGTGQGGTFGWMSYVQPVGGYLNNTPSAEALLTFTEPGGWEMWQDYTTAMDSCVFNHTLPPLPASYLPGAAWLDLDNAGTITRLADATNLVGPGFYGDAALGAGTEVVPGATYDLVAMAGAADWPAFDLPGFVEMPAPFVVLAPNMNTFYPPLVSSQINLSWNGGGGDYVLIYILRQFWDPFYGWFNDGEVTCAVYDDGAFTIPSTVWPTWYEYDILHIQVGHAFESSAVLPYNNAENRVVGIYWYYGGAETLP